MRTLYIDCFSGASGDMFLGALVDLGVDPAALERSLESLALGDFHFDFRRVSRSALSAVKVDVVIGGFVETVGGAVVEHHHGEHAPHPGHEGHHPAPSRSLAEIIRVIEDSSIPPNARNRAIRAFEKLGEAESRAHGTSLDHVHFHEVGAVDAIVDIVGTMLAIEMLGVERIICSAVNVGGGEVTFSHGTYPVPTPATVELLRDLPIYSGEIRKELVTPTGAAIIATIVDEFGSLPSMRVERVGYGAGTRDIPGRPNVLRLMLGDLQPSGETGDTIGVIEASIDDSTGESLGFFLERAMAEGALDVYYTPVTMKKSRPAVELTLLVAPTDIDRMIDLVFRETSTIGVRVRTSERRVLDRSWEPVETAAGPIRVKIARWKRRIVNVAPEYDDCREAALRTGLAFREIHSMAVAAYRERTHEEKKV